MTDRPILFTAPMVRALLAGRKTQTRRVAKRSNSTVLGVRWGPKAPWGGLLFDHSKAVARTTSTLMDVIVGKAEAPYDPHINVPWIHPDDAARGFKWEDDQCMYRVRPIWEIGDRLWVREAFTDDLKIYYCASEPANDRINWRSPLHMPRWASRLTLEVTGVKVELVQEISEEDAEAEGCEETCVGQIIAPARGNFALLWNSIHGPSAWEENKWVYALTFTVHKGNIDALEIGEVKAKVMR
jgi:hypothetical protein